MSHEGDMPLDVIWTSGGVAGTLRVIHFENIQILICKYHEVNIT